MAENLRRIRKEKKMTQFELAVKCDLSEAMIKNIELNRSWPSEKTLAKLTKALEIDIYKLFLPVSADLKEMKKIKESLKIAIETTIRTYLKEELFTNIAP